MTELTNEQQEREEVTGRLIRTILAKQRDLNALRDLKDRFLSGKAPQTEVVAVLRRRAPRWAKGLPQESGWYWARLNKVGQPIVVEFIWTPVSYGQGKVRLLPKVRYPGCDGWLEVEPTCNGYEFLGPITPTEYQGEM